MAVSKPRAKRDLVSYGVVLMVLPNSWNEQWYR